MEKKKIIMDVDTGTDDAVALIMAMLSDEIDLLGICTVNGNLEVKLTTDNTLRVVECCGKQNEVKVYKGCEYPLVSTLSADTPQSRYGIPRREGVNPPGAIHVDHLPLPKPSIREEDKCAAVWLTETLSAAKESEITIVAVGPVTNLAVAMRADPRIISKIKEIVLMGGGNETCNTTAAAEFNVFADPEAMEILMQSGCRITMVPLDATHKAYITRDEAERIAGIGTATAKFVSEVVLHRIDMYDRRDKDMSKLQAAPLHDALAVCAMLYPDVLRDVIECSCHIDTGGSLAYGRTVLDLRGRFNEEADYNCRFAQNTDREFFYRWIYDTLEKAK